MNYETTKHRNWTDQRKEKILEAMDEDTLLPDASLLRWHAELPHAG
jgi:hypothetical protein